MSRIRSGLVSLVVLAALSCGASVRAQTPEGLQLRRVVLFSSGVGYLERSGQIDGAASVELSFRPGQVNDILKSLVLFDPAGGVRPVSYATREPARGQHGPGGRPVDASITMGGLVRRFQGARLRLQTGAEAVEGRLVSVSARSVIVKDQTVQADVVNVLTDTGLLSVPLETVTEIRLLDERLDRQLRTALESLAAGLDDERRAVELRFGAGGARQVRAGYLQEMPVWKTSYRLVLDDNEKPYLQGWAIVENTTDEDWTDVRLSLVSGRPISFIQDLYQPLYVPRPVVQAQLVGSPEPQTYAESLVREELGAIVGQDLDNSLLGRKRAAVQRRTLGSPDGEDQLVSFDFRQVPLREAIDSLFEGSGQQHQIDPKVPNVPITATARDLGLINALRLLIRTASAQVPGLRFTRDGNVNTVGLRLQAPTAADKEQMAIVMAQSVASNTATAERGELFEYAIREPVTLAKQKAAMVPIVTSAVEGEKLSIFDPASDAKHALNGFRLKNSTGLHLSGGPITVFEGGVYAGDAQIGNLTPGEERLLSYAVDLELVVGHEEPKVRQETVSVSAKSGVLHITRKQQREHTYTFRNKATEKKTVLVEQALEPEFKLTQPEKPADQTAGEYRFRVEVPAGQSAELKVVTERPLTESIALLDADINLITAYAQNAQLSEKLRASLKELAQHRRKIADIQAERTKREAEIRTIDQEQNRIRQNMQQLDRNSALYQQYVRKLTEQESRIEKLREEIAKLREAEAEAQKALRAFTDGLSG